jgi:hypothetical protein
MRFLQEAGRFSRPRLILVKDIPALLTELQTAIVLSQTSREAEERGTWASSCKQHRQA